jgi:hypothetical protein
MLYCRARSPFSFSSRLPGGAQLVQEGYRVELHELAQHHAVELGGKAPHRVPLEQALGVAICEAGGNGR